MTDNLLDMIDFSEKPSYIMHRMHEQKIVDFIVLRAYDPDTLVAKVILYLGTGEGWQPWGETKVFQLHADSVYCLQAMVKYAWPKDAE